MFVHFPLQQNSRLDFNIYLYKKKEEQGLGEKVTVASVREAEWSQPEELQNSTLHSAQRVYIYIKKKYAM